MFKKGPQPPRTARTILMDHLARRDHSEKELRQKLRRSKMKFSAEQIEDAIQFAHENGWIIEGRVLAERVADQLHRRNKGILNIQKKLQEKGLPKVSSDPELELEKALQLAQTRKSQTDADRAKIGRFLLSRGFEPSIVRKVIYEKLK